MLACGPVIPTSHWKAVPPGRICSSAVATWVCVPKTALTRPKQLDLRHPAARQILERLVVEHRTSRGVLAIAAWDNDDLIHRAGMLTAMFLVLALAAGAAVGSVVVPQ